MFSRRRFSTKNFNIFIPVNFNCVCWETVTGLHPSKYADRYD